MATSSDTAAVMERVRGREGGNAQENEGRVKNYKGFVAGVFSGIAKLSGMLIIKVLSFPCSSSWMVRFGPLNHHPTLILYGYGIDSIVSVNDIYYRVMPYIFRAS